MKKFIAILLVFSTMGVVGMFGETKETKPSYKVLEDLYKTEKKTNETNKAAACDAFEKVYQGGGTTKEQRSALEDGKKALGCE